MNAALPAGVQTRDRAEHGQGGLPHQRHGDLQGHDGEAGGGQVARGRGRDCTICVTRYGNVMASRGSVIPLFVEQIRSGKPLTVTDPHMTRFMMSIEDAVDLVLYAFQHAEPGDIFVQKAPAATIETLARAVRRVFDADNPVQVIGTRHGEKAYETLLTREEMAAPKDLGGYFRVPADNRDLNYATYFSRRQRGAVAAGGLQLAQHAPPGRGRHGQLLLISSIACSKNWPNRRLRKVSYRMNVLVTGAAGFVGANLAAWLATHARAPCVWATTVKTAGAALAERLGRRPTSSFTWPASTAPRPSRVLSPATSEFTEQICCRCCGVGGQAHWSLSSSDPGRAGQPVRREQAARPRRRR